MSLAEIEQKVFELPEPERRQFVAWFYENEEKILPFADEPSNDEIAPEVMEELLRRRRELDEGTVKLYSPEEVSLRVREALHEHRRSGH